MPPIPKLSIAVLVPFIVIFPLPAADTNADVPPTIRFPLESSVIACVKVIAFPAVPEGALYQMCPPDVWAYLDAPTLDV